MVYIHNGILLGHKKDQNNAICSNMDGIRDSHSKWSKSEREGQIPYAITYMWNLKYGTNELIYKRETDSENREETCDCWGVVAGGEWIRSLVLTDANNYIENG